MSDDPQHAPPSTSTMALSFGEVVQQLPAGVKLRKDDGVTTLTVWIKGIMPALAMPCGGAMIVAFSANKIDLQPVHLVPIVAVTAYFSLGYLLGRRRVTLDGMSLRVRSIPFPLPGDGAVPIDEIDGLQVAVVGKKAGRLSYRLDALHRGKVRHLVHDLGSKEQAMVLARYLAQEHKLAAPTGVTTTP